MTIPLFILFHMFFFSSFVSLLILWSALRCWLEPVNVPIMCCFFILVRFLLLDLCYFIVSLCCPIIINVVFFFFFFENQFLCGFKSKSVDYVVFFCPFIVDIKMKWILNFIFDTEKKTQILYLHFDDVCKIRMWCEEIRPIKIVYDNFALESFTNGIEMIKAHMLAKKSVCVWSQNTTVSLSRSFDDLMNHFWAPSFIIRTI